MTTRAAGLLLLAAALVAAEPVPLPERPAHPGWIADDPRWTIQALPAVNGASAAYLRLLADGPVTVAVATPGRRSAPTVLPRRPGTGAVRRGATVAMTVPGPGTWTLVLDGEPAQGLHVAVDAPVAGTGSRPELTFGPGVHEVDTITLRDGDRLWLDPRAVLRPRPPAAEERPVVAKDWAGMPMWRPFIVADGATGVTIAGGGTIDLSRLPWHARMAVVFWRCTDVRVEGLTIIDAPTWGIAAFQCRDVAIRRVRNLSHRENSDGIDLCNTVRATVEDGFFRTNDDAVCVKTTEPPPAQMSSDITVRRVTVWNERARALGITSETRQDIARVAFTDCDIIRDFSTGGECAALAVLVADRGTMSEVSFTGIRLEHVRNTAALLRIGADAWGTDAERGRVRGVVFRDLAFAAGAPARWRVEGFSAAHMIEGLAIRGLTRDGRPARPEITANAWVGPIATDP
ncbi:MAG: hypothetical protein RLZZ127_492 [Planctomycetota bacterium]|jgi:hypothetical protein